MVPKPIHNRPPRRHHPRTLVINPPRCVFLLVPPIPFLPCPTLPYISFPSRSPTTTAPLPSFHSQAHSPYQLKVVLTPHIPIPGVLLHAEWVPGTGCVITKTNNTMLAATFIYSMAFDLIVLLLNAYKLLGISQMKVKGGKGEKGGSENAVAKGLMVSSRLGKMIFADGLIFFFIA